jgi:hypothetical protein
MSLFHPLQSRWHRLRGHGMRIARIALCLGAVCVSGCGLMLKLFPHRPTPQEVRTAIQRCGASPDSVRWRISEDGTLVFDPMTENGPPLPTQCLMNWGEWNRVRIALIVRVH